EDPANHVSEQLGDIDLSLAWPSISRSFAATGQFDWRNERVDGSISASDFVAMLSGDRSGLKARIVSAPLKLAFDGSVANRTSLMMEGTVTVDSPALRNALRWMGQQVPGSGGFGRFALKARANVVGASVALTNVNVELDGNVAEGVMTVANNGRQTLQATLAAGNLDFTPYISTVRLLASGARDWNRQLFDLNALSATDLDMRLSAARVTVGPTKLGRTAFGANLRNGALALSVGEAQMYGGIARGSFAVARSDTMADVRAQFQLADVDLQAAAGELFGVTKLSGRGNLNVSLVASGGHAGFELPFVIQGPWDDPLIFPDAESLIRRSPATAPLLDAVKAKKTRDAVKSVIERFTGGGLRPAGPEPAPAAVEAAKPD